MASSKAVNLTSWVLVVLLAIGFLLAGVGKVTGAQTEMFQGWGYAPRFAIFIGILELAGAVGLLIPKMTRLAVFGLTGLMIGACYTHIANAEAGQLIRPLLFLALLGGKYSR